MEPYRQTFATDGLGKVWELFFERDKDRHRPLDRAAWNARLGRADETFKWLEIMYENPTDTIFATEYYFDSLCGACCYEELLRKLKLPEEVIAKHLAR